MAKEDLDNRPTRLSESCYYIEKAIGNVTRISKALAPPFIQILGLAKSIKILTEDISAATPVKFTTSDSGLSLEGIDDRMLLNIYRIVQQQVHNIIQHAEASLVNIDISRYEDEVVLFIADNGNGYNMAEKQYGTGLKNITHLAALYNGNATVLSNPGQGFVLQVILRL